MIHKSEIADGWGKDALVRGKSQVNERSRRDYGKEYDYICSFLLLFHQITTRIMITLEKKSDNMLRELRLKGSVSIPTAVVNEFCEYCKKHGIIAHGGALSNDASTQIIYVDRDEDRINVFDYLSEETVRELMEALYNVNEELRGHFSLEELILYVPMFEHIFQLNTCACAKYLMNEKKKAAGV